jgi:hypothetical protein
LANLFAADYEVDAQIADGYQEPEGVDDYLREIEELGG